MTRQRTVVRYLLVAALFIVMSSMLVLTGCGAGKHTVTWNVDSHASVVVEGEKKLPEKVKDGTKLVFTVNTEEGYVVDEVLNGKRTLNPNSAGKYQVDVSADITITVTAKRAVTGITVQTKPTKLTYEAGQTLDKTGMVVQLEHSVGGPEVTNAYKIRYQGGAAASNFQLGDTYFTVYYEDYESAHVDLTEAAAAVIRLDVVGGTVSQDYLDTLAALKEAGTIDDYTSDNGITIKYTKALEENLPLPTTAQLTKGAVGDYVMNAWQVNGEGDWITTLSKDTVVSTNLVANWTANLAEDTSAHYEVTNDGVDLVVEGKFKAATELKLYLSEGNRKIYYVFDGSATGTRGENFTVRGNISSLINATAQDGGSYVGAWLDVKVAQVIGDRIEAMDLLWDESYNSKSVRDKEDAYEFSYIEYDNALKALISVTTPYTYEMSLENVDGNITLTFNGKITQKELETYKNQYVHMDWWIANTVGDVKVPIDAQGNWKVEYVLSPDTGWVLSTLGYAHFSIVTDSGEVLYKDGNDGNLLAKAGVLTNISELTQHNVPHGDFSKTSLEASSTDGTITYYVGISSWDAIVIYGLSPYTPTVLGDIELKVDNFEAPTKVYFVVRMTVGAGVTTENVYDKVVLGNTDGEINVYHADKERSSESAGVITAWYDITAYSGNQLWPNLYVETITGEDASYMKVGEVGGDSDYSTDGLYAIVGNVKYAIICSDGTYARPCVATSTPADGETNKDYVNPDVVAKTITEVDGAIELVEDNGKPYVKVTVAATGFATADELKNSVEYGNTDLHDEGDADNFEWKTTCTKAEVSGDNYILWFDISAIQVDKDGRLWSNLYLDGKKQEIHDTQCVSNGRTVTVGSTVYTIECTGANGTWNIPCITIKDVDAPEYTTKDAALRVDGSKVYLEVSGDYKGYEADALNAELSARYFDLQQNDQVAIGSAWDRHVLIGTVTVADGTWKVSYDVTDLGVNAYTAHFGGDNTDLKIGKALDSSEEVGDKVYTIFSDPDAKYGAHFWGCVGLIVAPKENVPQQMQMSYASLEEIDGSVYYVLYVSVSGYTKEQLQTYKMGTDYANSMTATKIDDVSAGVYKMYFDITNTSGNEWRWSHLYNAEGTGFDGGNGDINTDIGEGTLTVEGKTYRLYRGDNSYSIVVWYEEV